MPLPRPRSAPPPAGADLSADGRRCASGRLGAVRHAEIRVLRTRPSLSASPNDWRRDPAISGGGIFVDHGWHNLYLMRRLLGPKLSLVDVVLQPQSSADAVVFDASFDFCNSSCSRSNKSTTLP